MKKSARPPRRQRSRTPPPSGAIDVPARPTPAPDDARKARRAEERNTRRGPTDDELRDGAAELLRELRRIGALDYPGVREAWQALREARFYQLSGESGAYAAEVAALEADWYRPTARAASLVLHGADTALAPLVLRGDGSLDSSNDDDESLDSFIDDDESLDRDESEVEEAPVGSSESESDDEALEGDDQDWTMKLYLAAPSDSDN